MTIFRKIEIPRQWPRPLQVIGRGLGGLGIIVLFVALLGQLGAGGKALMRREVPGPISETVRPRIRETAIAMWVMSSSAVRTGLHSVSVHAW